MKVGEFGRIRPVIREWTTNPLRMARRTDVLLCVVGATCGKVNLGEECAIGRSVAAIRPHPSRIDQFYLYYFMLTLVERLRSGSVGAAQTVISKEMVATVQIPYPPLPEQQRIVGILDEAFAGLATAKANAEKNLQNARALFESHLNAVFSQRGEGWAEKKLVEVCAINSTLVDPRKEEFVDLTHVGAGNIESKTGVFVNLKTAREEGLISGKFLFDKSMVLYSKIRPYLMKVARPDFSGLCSADMYPLAPFPNRITRDCYRRCELVADQSV